MDKTNITIIGAGVIGLAAAYKLSEKYDDIIVIEKNESYGQETSSRNSEVIHSGLYYPKDSLKSRACIEGNEMLYELCVKNGIPHKRLGKIVVSCDKAETEKLVAIYNNAMICGVKGIRHLDSVELKKIEVGIAAKAAFFAPNTGIIDAHSLMKYFFQFSKAAGVNYAFGIEVIGIRRNRYGYTISVREPNGGQFSFQSLAVVNCAGLNGDKIAEMAGIDIDKNKYRQYYCKGQYFRIKNPDKFNIKHLIYPAPTNLSLGVHITPDMAGGLRLGPDAAFVESIDYNVREEDKVKFHEDVSRFLPNLSIEDIIPDTSGIRPKLHGPESVYADFIVKDEFFNNKPRFINAIGIESPGLTSCLAIANMIKSFIKMM